MKFFNKTWNKDSINAIQTLYMVIKAIPVKNYERNGIGKLSKANMHWIL